VLCLATAILVTIIQQRTLGENIEFTADNTKTAKVRNFLSLF